MRLREQLLISGVSPRSYYLGLFVVNGATFLVIALTLAIEMSFILKRTPFSLLLVTLPLLPHLPSTLPCIVLQ